MKKTIAAITAGLLLVAGQSVAQNSAASVRVGDRVGAQASDSSEFQDGGFPFLIVFVVVAVGLGIYASTSADDVPTSP